MVIKEMIKTISLILFIFSINLTLYFCSYKEVDSVNSKLKNMCSSIPLNESFIYYTENSIVKSNQGTLKIEYDTILDCTTARQIVSNYLKTNNWSQNTSSFTKGEFEIATSCRTNNYNKPYNRFWLMCNYKEIK
jgi:hypothetical protein